MTDRPDLTELERLLAEGTPGPWVVLNRQYVFVEREGRFEDPIAACSAAYGPANAALIVAAINALRFLLAEARKVETLREGARDD